VHLGNALGGMEISMLGSLKSSALRSTKTSTIGSMKSSARLESQITQRIEYSICRCTYNLVHIVASIHQLSSPQTYPYDFIVPRRQISY